MAKFNLVIATLVAVLALAFMIPTNATAAEAVNTEVNLGDLPRICGEEDQVCFRLGRSRHTFEQMAIGIAKKNEGVTAEDIILWSGWEPYRDMKVPAKIRFAYQITAPALVASIGN